MSLLEGARQETREMDAGATGSKTDSSPLKRIRSDGGGRSVSVYPLSNTAHQTPVARSKMPQISPTEFYALPLRVHTFLADVPLHDVWAVDLPTRCDRVTLSEFLRRANQGGVNRFPPMARELIRLRLFLGRIFRLEAEPKDALAASFASRLTPEDRARSSVACGTPEGLFRVVYRFENEQLLEVQNHTVHAAALSALAERADGYRFYFAVYVDQGKWITPFYMGLIDPFRKWIIYPAMLKTIRTAWDQNS
jgi:uncharacterized protein DUF2867